MKPITDKEQKIIYCACGCGKQISKLGNRYINGHNARDTYHSEEANRKNSERHKGKLNGMYGRHLSLKHRQALLKAITGRICSEGTKEKMSKIKKGKCLSEKHKNKLKENHKGFLGKHHSEEERKRISSRQKGIIRSEEYKRKMSIVHKRLWQNSEYARKQLGAMFTGRGVSPNKLERRLRNGLNKMFPNEYKYVGNGKFWIHGRSPDFININGQKKIIELFGDYWHGKKYRQLTFNDNSSNKEHEQQRINHFAKYGYKTLIIWEHELKNIKQLKKKLIKFHNGDFYDS